MVVVLNDVEEEAILVVVVMVLVVVLEVVGHGSYDFYGRGGDWRDGGGSYGCSDDSGSECSACRSGNGGICGVGGGRVRTILHRS